MRCSLRTKDRKARTRTLHICPKISVQEIKEDLLPPDWAVSGEGKTKHETFEWPGRKAIPFLTLTLRPMPNVQFQDSLSLKKGMFLAKEPHSPKRHVVSFTQHLFSKTNGILEVYACCTDPKASIPIHGSYEAKFHRPSESLQFILHIVRAE